MNGAGLERRKVLLEEERLFWQGITELAKNPVVELAAGSLFLNWLTMPHPNDNFFQGFMRGFEAPLLFTSLVGIITAQQLSPALPSLAGSLSGKVGELLQLPSGG